MSITMLKKISLFIIALIVSFGIVFLINSRKQDENMVDLGFLTETSIQLIDNNDNRNIKISINVEKNCFLAGEKIDLTLNFINYENEEVYVWASNYYYGGVYYGIHPVINNEVIDISGTFIVKRDGSIFPRQGDFILLNSNKSENILLYNFFYLFMPYFENIRGFIYLKIKYYNGFWGVIEPQENLRFSIHDLNAWTGTLYSNSIMIQIVDNYYECLK